MPLRDRLYDILLSTDLCSRLRFPFQADTVPAWMMTVREQGEQRAQAPAVEAGGPSRSPPLTISAGVGQVRLRSGKLLHSSSNETRGDGATRPVSAEAGAPAEDPDAGSLTDVHP